MQKMKYLGLIIAFCLLVTACNSLTPTSPPEPNSDLAEPPTQEETVLQLPIPVEQDEIEPEPPASNSHSSENWPEHFAALVEELANHRSYVNYIPNLNQLAMSLHLMDITLDGVPNLLIIVATEAGWGPTLMAFSWDFPATEIAGLSPREAAFSGIPLRLFRNDNTGEIIYSSLIGDHFFQGIAYNFSDGLLPYRVVGCQFGVHTLHDSTGVDRAARHLWRLIEEIDTGYEYNPYGPPECDCGIRYGRNSLDPTIVHLVNRALEGFTEIPAPPTYTFGVSFGWDDETQAVITLADRVDEIQQWIFEVAESWDA